MGRAYEAKCQDCETCFILPMGRGMNFEQLRCEVCGCDIAVRLPYDQDEDWPLRGLYGAEYKAGLEKLAGKCRCGGHFKLDAPARCPECRSTNLVDTGRESIMYD